MQDLSHLPLPARKPDAVYDAGRGCTVLRYDQAQRAEFDAVCAALESAGLPLLARTTLERNTHCTFGGSETVHFYYCANEATLRILRDPNTAQPNRTPDHAQICAPALWQFEIDHALIDCGMCYILRANNGHFFLIDSAHGYSVRDDRRICAFLRSLTGGETPIVDGWFFTHGHDDHVDIFLDILEYRKDAPDIRAVYYNFPPSNHRDSGAWNPSGRSVMNRFEHVMDAHPALKKIRLHTGQQFYIGALKFTVLCTHEDIYPRPMTDFNNTSTALMMEMDGCRVCFPGDCSAESNRVLLDRYTAETLRCDIMQMAHHGHFGLSPEFYRRANAACCLFPVTQIKFDEELPRQKANPVAIGLCKEYHIASNGTVKIPLPYRFGQTERLPDEIFEDFDGIYQLWTYEYAQDYKDALYQAYLSRGGKPLAAD